MAAGSRTETLNPTSPGTHRLASVSLFAGGTNGAGSAGGTGSAGSTHGAGLAAIALRADSGVVRPVRSFAAFWCPESEHQGGARSKLTFTPAAPSLPGGPSAPGLPWEEKRRNYHPGMAQDVCKVAFRGKKMLVERCWRAPGAELRPGLMVMPGAAGVTAWLEAPIRFPRVFPQGGVRLPRAQARQQVLSGRGDPRGRGGLGRPQSRVLLASQVRPKRGEKSA